MKKIAIRMGHTILTSGLCTSANGIRSEYKMIREYAPLVIKYLGQLGYEVTNITPKDKSFNNEILDINAGIKMANDLKVNLFVSLHCNCSDGSGHGCEVLYTDGNAVGQKLATDVSNTIATLGFKNRGAKADVRGLNEMTRTNMTAIIIEPLFCDSAVDIKLYNADQLARAIVKGITGQDVPKTTTLPKGYAFIKEGVVIADKLNCRKEPVTGDIITQFSKGDKLTFVDYSVDKKWGKLITSKWTGWICLEYLKLI